jgi:hypothetical protein
MEPLETRIRAVVADQDLQVDQQAVQVDLVLSLFDMQWRRLPQHSEHLLQRQLALLFKYLISMLDTHGLERLPKTVQLL